MATHSYMTFTEHLEELRWRLLKSLGAVALAFGFCYAESDRLFALMIAPLQRSLQPGQSLIGTGVTEAFFIEMKVGFVGGLFLAAPVIFYQVWRFLAPGLLGREKKLVVPFVLCATGFFLGGAYFCYRIVLPIAFVYFIEQYQSLGVSPEIRIGEYFSFFFRMVLAFGVTFELPVFTFFLAQLGIVDHRLMLRSFRYAIVLIFVAAAILTPTPDIINQTLLAAPMLILYALSIAVAYIWGKRRDETT